jgi:tetratricopeptide (TPR) repeat protein
MYCNKCGKSNPESGRFCKHCGVKLSHFAKEDSNQMSFSPAVIKKPFNFKWIIRIIVAIVILGFIFYGSQNDTAVKTNNEGLTSFDSGDSMTAASQFQQAAKDATDNDTKREVLINLGYVYASDGKYDLALSTFQEALALASEETFDYYLISGEIALFENKPNSALLSYNKAYQINPEDFQINNALNLFYLDVDGIAPQYSNYKKALAYAQKAYELNKSETAKQNLAMAYYYNENYNQTISLLSSSNLDQQPYAAYWLGLAYSQIDDSTNAKIYLQKAIDGGTEASQEVLDYLNSN